MAEQNEKNYNLENINPIIGAEDSDSFEIGVEEGPDSTIISVGISWEFFKGMAKVDLDASAVAFSTTGSLVDAAFFNQLSCCSGAITHSGDNKSGDKEGYDEELKVDLSKLTGVSAIVFLLSAFSGGNLKDCESASCQIKQGSNELAMITASGPQSGAKTGFLFFMLFRHQDTLKWHFKKIHRQVNARHFVACIPTMRDLVDPILDPGVIMERALTPDKTFSMNKGDGFLLPESVDKVTIGLGWTTTCSVDLDASCLFLCDKDNDGDLDPVDGVYFNAKSKPGVTHTGDNVTGDGDGDDEQILVEFSKVPEHIVSLAFCVNIFTASRSFGDVSEAYIRLFDSTSNHEFCRYKINHENIGSRKGLVFCTLNRGQTGPWSIVSVGEPCDGHTCMEVSTSLWDGKWDGSTTRSGTDGDPCDGCCTIV